MSQMTKYEKDNIRRQAEILAAQMREKREKITVRSYLPVKCCLKRCHRGRGVSVSIQRQHFFSYKVLYK